MHSNQIPKHKQLSNSSFKSTAKVLSISLISYSSNLFHVFSGAARLVQSLNHKTASDLAEAFNSAEIPARCLSKDTEWVCWAVVWICSVEVSMLTIGTRVEVAAQLMTSQLLLCVKEELLLMLACLPAVDSVISQCTLSIEAENNNNKYNERVIL